MRDVNLVRLDPAIEASLADDPAYFDAMSRSDWAHVAKLVHQKVGVVLEATPVSTNELAWGGYFVIDADTREVVGSCAFKHEPTDDGTVEIAYFTYPTFEGQGYATLMARRLVELASQSPTVKRVVAHTLPETSASTRVLEKAAMEFVGAVVDPDDGQVWQWQTQVRA